MIHRFVMIVSALLLAATVSCSDDLADSATQGNLSQMRQPLQVNNPGGLIQQADGTWKTQNCRVPIVGPGRVINELYTSTISAISLNQDLTPIVDTDIENAASIPVTVGVDVGDQPVISVKDLYHIYAAGQKTGFVYNDTKEHGGSLLTLEVLKGLTITTYLKGKQQEKIRTGNKDSNVLNLDVLTINAGDKSDRVIAIDATKPFDEIRLSLSGVSAGVAATFAVKYAFVGENPEIRATSEEVFKSYWKNGLPSINGEDLFTDIKDKNANKIVDDDITGNYGDINSGILGVIGPTHRATVNFNNEIPAGTEIGVNYSGGSVLNLDLLKDGKHPHLTTYDANNKEVEEMQLGASVLRVGLLATAKNAFINMRTTKPCTQLKIIRPTGGLLGLLDISNLHVYYTYIREAVKTDPANYFTFGEDSTYNYVYTLPQPQEGTVEYVLLAQPYGSDAKIENGKLTGLVKDGAYRVQALYTATDGRQVSHTGTIYHLTATPVAGCNNYITARSHGAYPTEALGSDICLLCLFNGTNKLSNVVDSNDDNYATAYKIATVLGEKPVAAFQWNELIRPAKGEKLRTGFIVQTNSKLLDLTALTHYKIRLYHDKQLISEEPAADKSNIKLGLLGFNKDQMQLSVETDQAFNRIELWDKGTASVLPTIRLHHIFYEPASCHDADGAGGCMELMTNLKDNLQVDYKGTGGGGLLTVGSALTDLDLIYDGSTRTGAEINGLLGLASGTDIALTFDTKKANQTVGIILKGADGLLNANVLKGASLKVYKDDKPVARTVDFETIGANALSEGGYHYIEVTPSEDFNRIVYHTGTFINTDITLTGNSTLFCGVYIRPDKDSDGIPDCADTENAAHAMTFENDTHSCVGNDLNIGVENVPTGMRRVYVYCYNEDLKKEFNRDAIITGNTMTISAEAGLPAGRYLLYVYSEEGQLLTLDLKATVHPSLSTWKLDAADTDWHRWENWEEGSPWACTNVILPSYAARYPVLTSESHCSNIHFEHGAELLGTQHLHYTEASIDLALQGGRTRLLSAPLQGMVTGDFFVSPGVQWDRSKYFHDLLQTSYPESRHRPIVYQHLWNCEALEYDDLGATTDVGRENGWSADFNSVNTPYATCQAFLLRAGAPTDHSRYTFRFPKKHTEYHYYDSQGNLRPQTAAIPRTDTGRLALTAPATVTLFNRKAAANTFVMGNPFMAHIKVAELLAANPAIEAVRVVSAASYNPEADIEDQTTLCQRGTNRLISPMEGFFVIAKTAAQELQVTLTEQMLVQKNQAAARQSNFKRK